MDTFKSGQPVELTLSLTVGEEVLAPTALTLKIQDEMGSEIISAQVVPLPDPSADTVNVTVPAAANALVPPAVRGVRVATLSVVLADSRVVEIEQAYFIEASTLLVPGVNSFVTFYQAALEARLYSDDTLPGWTAADETSRVRALAEAFIRIRDLDIIIDWENNQSIITDRFFDPPRLRDLSPDQILALDKRLLSALGRAQLVEANSIMTPDPVSEYRRQGIQSMTVGESSQYFGAQRPLINAGGCNDVTMRILSKWLRSNKRIYRA